MLSHDDARRMASEYIESTCGLLVDGGVSIVDSKTVCREYGWVFFYNSNDFLSTGNFMYALGGNGPIVVLANSGEICPLGTAGPWSVQLEEFEKKRGFLR